MRAIRTIPNRNFHAFSASPLAMLRLTLAGRRLEKECSRLRKSRADESRLIGKLKQLSILDDLTGLYNTRYFWARLRYEFLRCLRYAQPLSLILLDLDRFKAVNDRYGHRTGDDVLSRVSRAVARGVRQVDFVARYGGEEFAVLLPNTDLPGALRCAEGVRRRVEKMRFRFRKNAAGRANSSHCIRITASLGAALAAEDVKTPDQLVRRADAALLRAKAAGRNRVCAWEKAGA